MRRRGRSIPPPPPPTNPAVLPVLATVTYVAGIVGIWGFTSLLLDRDVIGYPDAGPLLGPAMAVAATVVTFLATLGVIRLRSPLAAALGSTAVAYIAMVLVGAVGYGITRADASWMLLAGSHFALSPFVAGAAVLSGLLVLGTWALAMRSGA